MNLRGLIIPLITPFNENLDIDFDALGWLIEYLIEHRVDGIFPISTTGEFPSLKFDEKIKIVEKVVDKASSKTTVIAGVSSTSLYEAKEMARRFGDIGVDVLISTPPYYYKPSIEGIERYFKLLLESIDKPLILYTIPVFTGIEVPPETILRLAKEYDNLVGLKATVDSMVYIRRVIDTIKPVKRDFRVYTGIDEYILPAISIGGDGAVSALAHLTPDLHKKMITEALNGKFDDALDKYKRILKVKRIYEISNSTSAAIKSSLEILKTPVRRFVRPPLTNDDEETINLLRRILHDSKDDIPLFKANEV